MHYLDFERPFETFSTDDVDAISLGLFGDGLVQFAALTVVLALHVRHMLRDEQRRVHWALLGAIALGVGVRLAMSVPAPMEGWFYLRVVPLADKAFRGPLIQGLSHLVPWRIYQSDVGQWTSFALSTVTPLVFFAHARYALKDTRAGLAAAFVVAVLPVHVRFARSDVYNVQTLVASSFTFVMLYAALHERDKRWTTVAFLTLPVLSLGTYFSRPEAIAFWPLDVAATLVASRGLEQRWRRNLVILILSATGIAVLVMDPFRRYAETGNVASLQTLRNAMQNFLTTRNGLLDPAVTPLPLTPLALFGAGALWWRGERLRTLLLVGWLLFFYVVTSYVPPANPAMGARYQLALATPFVLMIAGAAPVLARWPAKAWGPVAALVLAAPLFARSFIRDVEFDEQREWAFLVSMRDRVPDGCTVIETRETMVFADPPQLYFSRLRRVGTFLQRGRYQEAWKGVPLATDFRAPDGTVTEKLTPEAEAVLASPPACLMYYEGLACWRSRTGPGRFAPACSDMRERAALTPVDEREMLSRDYARGCSGALLLPQDGTGSEYFPNPIAGQPVKVSMHRVAPRPQEAAGAPSP
jgi:hypothetical protein